MWPQTDSLLAESLVLRNRQLQTSANRLQLKTEGQSSNMKSSLFNTEIVLENERILLLPFETQRNQELKEVIFDDSIWKYMGMYIRTQSDFDEYVRLTLDQKNRGICYPFVVIDKLSGRVAGSTRYGYIHAPNQKCEIGWTWYGKEFQGTGLNKACKYELLKFGFENIGFQRIQFSADTENARSQKAILKLGATKEGIFRNNYIDSEGMSRDDVYFSILQEEWVDIKSSVFSKFNNK